MILLIAWINLILFLWFDTEAFISYFKWVNIFKIKEYETYRNITNGRIKYFDFLLLQNNNFFTKLISCRPCLCFWISLFFTFISDYGFIEFPFIYLTSYVIYKILNRHVY